MHRAVVHVPEEARVDRALRNVRNLLDDFGREVEVVMVLNGDAVGALAPGSAHIDAMRKLRLCRNPLYSLRDCQNQYR